MPARIDVGGRSLPDTPPGAGSVIRSDGPGARRRGPLSGGGAVILDPREGFC